MRHPFVARSALLAFALALTAGCNCGGGQIGRTNGEVVVIWRDAAGERISSRDATFDFGNALIGERKTLSMLVRNTGAGKLTLAKLEKSDGDEVAIGLPGHVPATATLHEPRGPNPNTAALSLRRHPARVK